MFYSLYTYEAHVSFRFHWIHQILMSSSWRMGKEGSNLWTEETQGGDRGRGRGGREEGMGGQIGGHILTGSTCLIVSIQMRHTFPLDFTELTRYSWVLPRPPGEQEGECKTRGKENKGGGFSKFPGERASRGNKQREGGQKYGVSLPGLRV